MRDGATQNPERLKVLEELRSAAARRIEQEQRWSSAFWHLIEGRKRARRSFQQTLH
jgi:hypothetical protein